MSTFNNIDEAREFFKGDTFASTNGMVIDELYDDGSLCSMTLRDDHRNAMGGVMGGVIFTLCDFAFAVASNNDHKGTVALDVNISYLSSTKGSKLFARAKCVKSGRTTSVYQVSVTDDLGKDIALFTGTGYKL